MAERLRAGGGGVLALGARAAPSRLRPATLLRASLWIPRSHELPLPAAAPAARSYTLAEKVLGVDPWWRFTDHAPAYAGPAIELAADFAAVLAPPAFTYRLLVLEGREGNPL